MTTSRTTTASASRDLSASKHRARLLVGALALGTALTPVSVVAQNLPTGGTVAHGTASIVTTAPNAMTITQGSDRAIVNWDGFSIGQGSRVDINQPSSTSAILNRVTGDTTSQIHGQLNANGRVFVVNPNGVFIGATGAVNSGGFVASTLAIRNDDFVTGNLEFEGDGSSATVENRGTLQIVRGGYAALIGGKVKNSGTIQAPLGFVGLASGERVTLDLAGDGFLQVAVPTDSDDDGLEALIENSGTIKANGGTVQMSAATARNAARHAINLTGVVEARTVSGRNGRVTLGGGNGGRVSVSGKVSTRTITRTRPAIQVVQSARPAARPERGGDIIITGRDISLAGAEIDASGINGGGNINIGGALQGGPGLPTAELLTVDTATRISADGITAGDGGRIILWSDVRTDFAGVVNVRGGSVSGNGGFAEVSGKENLRYAGFTDARAANGETGELLLDPADIEIVDGNIGDPTPLNQINDADLESQLLGANVTIATSGPNLPPGALEQPGDLGTITVTALADVEWNTASTLALVADQDIILNGDITNDGGGVSLTADGRVVLNGTLTIDGSDLSITAGDDFTVAGSGLLDVQNATVTAGASDIELDGTLTFTNSLTTMNAADSFVVETPNVFDGANSATTLGGDTIEIARPLAIANGALTIAAGSSLNITTAGAINGANAITTISSGGPVTLNGPIITPSGELTIGAISSTVTPGIGGQIETGLFNFTTGAWDQNGLGTGIASFEADNFVINPISPFLRVENGDGLSPTTAFEVTDIYGLQGMPTIGGSPQFTLPGDIDAGLAAGWYSLAAPVLGTIDRGFVPLDFNGILNGNRNDISNLYVRQYGFTPGSGNAGLFDTIGAGGTVIQLNVTSADVAGNTAGILAAQNDGFIFGVSTTGAVEQLGDFSIYGYAGGIVGINTGDLGASYSNILLSDAIDPSGYSGTPSPYLYMGGIAGRNSGDIRGTRSSGSIFYDDAQVGYIGGIAGQNVDAVEDSYSDAAVSGDSTGGTGAHVGGITGDNIGVVARTIATGPVSLTGAPGAGGVGGTTGTDAPSDVSVISSFFSVAGTGQTISGTNGENTGVGPGIGTYFEGSVPDAEVNPGDSFVGLTDLEPFAFLASAGGNWDFDNVWAYPQDGVDQARLYAIDPVISATDFITPTPEIEYAGQAATFAGIAPVYSGGPTRYLFGPLDDSGDLTVLADGITLSSPDVGAQTYTFPTTFTSDQGQIFDVRSFDSPLTITPAPLTITVDDLDKVFGTELDPAEVTFTTATLFAGDTITGFDATSLGAPADATIDGSPYDLSVSNLTGPRLTNYTITIVPGDLFVIPGDDGGGGVEFFTLEISVDNLIKTYGDTILFDGTEFSVSGLNEGDSVDSLTLSSEGAPATATVADSPYDIIGQDPIGTGLANYSISIIPGTLTVLPAPLSVTVDSLTKDYGDEVTFDGTEFTTTGLVNDDTLTALDIASLGAPATAQVVDAPFAITGEAPVGTGLSNYDVTIVPGELTLTAAPLSVTVEDAEKEYGETLTFDGTEFSVTGLINDDAITSFNITSAGAAPDANVADGPFDITADTPTGTGVGNYDISVTPGTLTITPAPLTVTADDQTKPFGSEFVFEGTEFSVAGLLNADVVASAEISSDAAAPDAPFTAEAGVAVLITGAEGTGLENYTITFVAGVFFIAPGNLLITANDQTKTYGEDFVFAGTEFSVEGLAPGDSVDRVTLSSAGATGFATVSDSPYIITASDAVGTGLERYTLSFADGSFTVVPAPLTVTANDQSKTEGQAFTFDGTEFTTAGLLNADNVTSAVLSSAGADVAALAADSPFTINVGALTGTGLDNYIVATATGAFTVSLSGVTPPEVNPPVSLTPRIENGRDRLDIGFPIGDDGGRAGLRDGDGVQNLAPGSDGPQQDIGDAEATLAVVETLSTDLELAVQSCGSPDEDFTNYMSCLSESLDTYSSALDQISNDLPRGLETVSATIRTASDEVRAAAARAITRLATATNATQRRAIQREAVAEARAAIDTAKEEIRKAITLIRADDPEVQAVQQQTGARVVAAFDTVDSALARATEL